MKLIVALLGLAVALNACSAAPPTPPGVKVGKPYTVGNQTYYPEYEPHYDKIGMASWYGPGFHGGKTASGERFDQNELTAAHPTLPMPSLVRVTNLSTGKSAVIRINDRGPFKDNRLIDLSRGSARALGITGLQRVRVEYLKDETEAYWAKMDLKTDEIQFAKNDPNAPGSGGDEQKPGETDDSGSMQVAAQTAPQVTSYAPITSVAAADLTPDKLKIRPIQPRFRVVEDAQAHESPKAGKGSDPPPAPREDPAAQHDTDESVQPKIVNLLDKRGQPVGLSPQSEIKLVRLDRDEKPPALDDAAAKPVPASAQHGQWFIQAGAFASEDNAKKLASRLQKLAGVEVREVQSGGKTWHRVRLGPFGDHSAAVRALEQAVSTGAVGARLVQD